jgi:hypothetical protein
MGRTRKTNGSQKTARSEETARARCSYGSACPGVVVRSMKGSMKQDRQVGVASSSLLNLTHAATQYASAVGHGQEKGIASTARSGINSTLWFNGR